MASQNSRTIADFSISRDTVGGTYTSTYLSFLEPLMGPVDANDDEWQFFSNSQVADPDPHSDSDGSSSSSSSSESSPERTWLHTYAVSAASQAYVVTSAQLTDLTDPLRRVTNMRLFEMIRDNWAAAAPGVPLRFLVVRQIENRPSRAAIFREFRAAGDGTALQIRVTPATSVSGHENPFFRCAEHVGDDASRMVVHYFREDATENALNNVHMVVDFTPDAGQGDDDSNEGSEDEMDEEW